MSLKIGRGSYLIAKKNAHRPNNMICKLKSRKTKKLEARSDPDEERTNMAKGALANPRQPTLVDRTKDGLLSLYR
jgi:hypothetical protein